MTTQKIITNVSADVKKSNRGRKKVERVEIEIANRVEVPTVEVGRGKQQFTKSITANNIVRLLNLPSGDKPTKLQNMRSLQTASLTGDDDFMNEFESGLMMLGVERTQTDELYGINNHQIATFGNTPVTESEIDDTERKIDHLAKFFGGTDSKHDYTFLLRQWSDDAIDQAFENFAKLVKISESVAWRLHVIRLRGALDVYGTVGTVILYRIENKGERRESIIKAAIRYAYSNGLYIPTADDDQLGQTQTDDLEDVDQEDEEE